MPTASEKTREKTGTKRGPPSTTAQAIQLFRVDLSASALARRRAARKHFVTLVNKIAKGNTSFSELYRSNFLDRQAIILGGLPAETPQVIARDMGVSNELIYDAIGAPRATVNRQLRTDKPLSTAASERAVFLAELVNIVKEAIPEENARASNFDAAQWIGRWIANPLPALGGAAPKDYFATGDGRTIVKRLLGNTISGDYA